MSFLGAREPVHLCGGRCEREEEGDEQPHGREDHRREQRRLGGEPDRCSVYLLNLFHMVEDDAELRELRRACRAGELLCGPCKKATLERAAFLSDFRGKMDAVELPEEG